MDMKEKRLLRRISAGREREREKGQGESRAIDSDKKGRRAGELQTKKGAAC